jgi:hypothetical protein
MRFMVVRWVRWLLLQASLNIGDIFFLLCLV